MYSGFGFYLLGFEWFGWWGYCGLMVLGYGVLGTTRVFCFRKWELLGKMDFYLFTGKALPKCMPFLVKESHFCKRKQWECEVTFWRSQTLIHLQEMFWKQWRGPLKSLFFSQKRPGFTENYFCFCYQTAHKFSLSFLNSRIGIILILFVITANDSDTNVNEWKTWYIVRNYYDKASMCSMLGWSHPFFFDKCRSLVILLLILLFQQFNFLFKIFFFSI